MEFSENTIIQAFRRSGGRCECTRSSHHHLLNRCTNSLIWAMRGIRTGQPDAWEANHINRVESGGDNSLSNCEILCWPCHKATL